MHCASGVPVGPYMDDAWFMSRPVVSTPWPRGGECESAVAFPLVEGDTDGFALAVGFTPFAHATVLPPRPWWASQCQCRSVVFPQLHGGVRVVPVAVVLSPLARCVGCAMVWVPPVCRGGENLILLLGD